MKYKMLMVLFTLFVMNLVEQPTPEVKVEQGILTGIVSSDGSFYEYLGVPYASVKKRFQAPSLPLKWNGVYKAVDEHMHCVQRTKFGVIGTEDCLRLNIYAPINAKQLPVMVYIHGGAFVLGSNSRLLFGPEFLMKYGVILVVVNYRLGPFGFTCLRIKEAPGNAGLKDQIAALKWVQRNIKAFGGDPDNVTLFGQSAGATSTSLLIASPATNGIFHKAIVESGSCIANWALDRDPITKAKKIASNLGNDFQDLKEMYEFLATLPYKDLMLATEGTPTSQALAYKEMQLPCVEKKIEGEETAINDLPYNLVLKNIKNISIMYGSTDKEGLFMLYDETADSLATRNKINLLTDDLLFTTKDEKRKLEQQIREFYFGNEEISIKTQMNLSQFYGHMYFEMPINIEAELMSQKGVSVYSYYFTYLGGRNMFKYFLGDSHTPGASHADEILYIFSSKLLPFKIKTRDQRVIDRMTKMFTNFAKYGNPTLVLDKDLPLQWLPHTKDALNFLYISDDLKMGPVPNPDFFKLWKEIYEKHRNLQIPTLQFN